MPGIFADSHGKRVVREQWNTPLLRHLHDRYGFTYRYFGLPGPDILDIELWRDMIKEVIAFEVPVEGARDERINIIKLREKLELRGIPNETYYGPFEQVILLGRDFDGQIYNQENVITLYNLDFCGEVGSRIKSSTGEEYYRFEAIRQVIRNQAQCFSRLGHQSCFLILLTVRNQINSWVLQERLAACRPICEDFVRACESKIPIVEGKKLIGTHAWGLKTIILTIFSECLKGNNISALFFPFVKYEGVRKRISRTETIPSPMLHFMIFCKFQHPREVTGVGVPSNPFELKSLAVRDGSLIVSPEPGEVSDGHLSAVEYFEALKGGILREDECLVS